jgi:hypothetical protein
MKHPAQHRCPVCQSTFAHSGKAVYCGAICRRKAERDRRRLGSAPRRITTAGPRVWGGLAHGRIASEALWRLAESNPTPERYAREREAILARKP